MALRLLTTNILNSNKRFNLYLRTFSSVSCTKFKEDAELSNEIKHKIEKHWREKIMNQNAFKSDNEKQKFYVLSMFPYPSGQLHMGHVRVYAISDAIARFYRMNGKNVFHPMGWDAFGLPAENAAILRNIPADVWTKENIQNMKEQLNNLGCSFDWNCEIATCNPDYYKWTQKIFLQLHEAGLAYQKEALVNWDPIDQTVLADEQVDNNGCSWRSGAKVEKKLLKQWFIRTTKFAKSLLDGLSDPSLKDWKDIIKLQKHWIGECDGYSFDLRVKSENDSKIKSLFLWTKNPEDFKYSSFIAIKSDHLLSKDFDPNLQVFNPFTEEYLPIIQTDELEFSENCDVRLGVPSRNDCDRIISEKHNLSYTDKIPLLEERTEILEKAHSLNIGGYPVSSKLKDWLISRQRYWGTPIPIIYCPKCGTVPCDDKNLPVTLPAFEPNSTVMPTKNPSFLKTECPKCGSEAKRESDTMDTFVDSSWYFLRYIDSKNDQKMFDENLVNKLMSVDLYIGGKEHAVLHLYYARFINHFLHSIGLVPNKEPFKRLLVQGMVMGRSFRVKGSGKYLTEADITFTDDKKKKAIETSTGSAVIVTWEKMSKSKFNGVDPAEFISEYSSDTTRLIILADVAPTSHRNWSTATFPGILNWQKRLWLTIEQFHDARSCIEESTVVPDSPEFLENDMKMNDARNFYIKGATFNYKFAHQLSVAISKMQGLTNSIRRAPKEVLMFGKEYERALATQIIMLAPMAPHFASELWRKFTSVPNRTNKQISDIKWDCDVLEQTWPDVDKEYKLDLSVKINGFENCVIKIPRIQHDKISHEDALKLALEQQTVISYMSDKKIGHTTFEHYFGCDATVHLFLEKRVKNVSLEAEIQQ